jgi:uncharacterized protein YqeY
MTIEERLNQELIKAMKARDQKVTDAIKMVKTRIAEKRTSKDFKGTITDEVVSEVIEAYMRQLKKGIEEMKQVAGEDHPLLQKYRFEIDYLSGFLPKKMGEEEMRALIKEKIVALGVSGKGSSGKVMGAIMKEYKDKVDGALLRKLVEEELEKTG